MKLKFATVATLMCMITPAHADCYARSASVNTMPLKIERVSDFQKEVLPKGSDKLMCRITFRAQIKGQWYTAQGESTGRVSDNLDGLCASAEQLGRSRILTEIGGSDISVDTDMVCTDQNIPKVRPVELGEIVSQSDVAPNPQKLGSFQYMGTECRWFLETMPLGIGGLIQNQGIICRLRDNQWVVRDKWIQVVDK